MEKIQSSFLDKCSHYRLLIWWFHFHETQDRCELLMLLLLCFMSSRLFITMLVYFENVPAYARKLLCILWKRINNDVILLCSCRRLSLWLGLCHCHLLLSCFWWSLWLFPCLQKHTVVFLFPSWHHSDKHLFPDRLHESITQIIFFFQVSHFHLKVWGPCNIYQIIASISLTDKNSEVPLRYFHLLHQPALIASTTHPWFVKTTDFQLKLFLPL